MENLPGIDIEVLVRENVAHTFDAMPVNVGIVRKQFPFGLFVDLFEVLRGR